MAENPIRHTEIIEIDKTIAGIKGIIKQLEQLQKTIKATAKTLISFQQRQNIATPGGRQATQQTATDIEKLVQKNKKLTVSIKDLTKEQVRLTEERRRTRQALKQEIQAEDSAAGSLDRLRAKLNQMTSAYSKATPAVRKKLAPAMSQLNKRILESEKAVGRHQRDVGNYPKVLGKAKQAMLAFGAGVVGATALIAGMSRAIKNSISIVLNFDQAMADVQAITRASEQEILMLRDAAKALGGTTKFTATEVAKLQKELGKLGFTVSETLLATGGILALAAALDEDLARSAEVAGATVRAFGLNANETQRVVDIMARSFSGSALTLERFSVSMRSVGPVAKAFGFDVAETTALLGSLANAGFDASMAGTATRNILLNLADTSGALAKKLGGTVNTFDKFIPALIELRDRGVDLNTVLELTDKRSVAAFSRFLEGAEFTRKFADELRLAAGAAEEMAEIQLNTLKGDLIILRSAFQGLIIETSDTNTAMNDTARGGVRLLTDGLVLLKDEVAETESVWDKIRKTFIRIMSPMGLPALIDLLRLAKERTEEFGTATKELADNTRILTWEQQRQLDLEVKRQAGALAEIERKKELLKLLTERAEKNLNIFARETDLMEQELGLFLRIENSKDFALAERLKKQEERERKSREFRSKLEKEFEKDAEARRKRAKARRKKEEKEEAAARKKAEDDEKRGKEAVLMATANLLFAFNDLRMSKLEEEKRREIELAGGNKTKIAAIEKKFAKKQQGIAFSNALINSAVAITKVFGSIIPPFSFIVAGLTAAATGVQIGIIKAQKFALGGHGKLRGERHHSGGTYLPGIGVAEKDEYFGIVNRQMTRKYQNDLPAIFDSLNAGRFHDVWSNANIQLQSEIDPWTKKIYDTLQSQATVYTDSGGDTVKEYPNGKKVIIRGK